MQKYTLYMTSKIWYPTLKIYNKCKYQPMTMWTYKIKTAVNSVVYYVPSIKAWFILQVSLVLLVNVVSYSLPTIQYKKKKTSLFVSNSWL